MDTLSTETRGPRQRLGLRERTGVEPMRHRCKQIGEGLVLTKKENKGRSADQSRRTWKQQRTVIMQRSTPVISSRFLSGKDNYTFTDRL